MPAADFSDVVIAVNDVILGEKGLRALFNVLGRNQVSFKYGATTIEMYRTMGQRLWVGLSNEVTNAAIKLSGDLGNTTVGSVEETSGSQKNIRGMVREFTNNFNPIKASLA